MLTIIDLSQPLRVDSLSYPGIRPALTFESVEFGVPTAQLSRLTSLDLHAGTHMDAPLHFSPAGADIAGVALRPLPVVLVCAPEREIGKDRIPLDCSGKAVLISTGWERHAGTANYFSDFPYLTEEAAHTLVERGTKLIGLDSPSVDPAVPDATYPAHTTLCDAGIPIVEGLINLTSLRRIDAPIYFLALPLQLEGFEASPVRAVALVQ